MVFLVFVFPTDGITLARGIAIKPPPWAPPQLGRYVWFFWWFEGKIIKNESSGDSLGFRPDLRIIGCWKRPFLGYQAPAPPGATDIACASEWVNHALHDRGWLRTYVASWYMKRFTRCGPLMHRVDEDQRIDGDPLGFRARGAKVLFWCCFGGARGGGW